MELIKIKHKIYSDYYALDDKGNVYSLHNTEPRKLKPYIGTNGYSVVSLSVNYKMKLATVHRLVADVFIPNVENKEEVNHIDGNKNNNHPSNLEWVTKSENRIHSIEMLGEKSNFLNPSVQKKARNNMRATLATMTQDMASELVEMIEYTKISIREASRITGISRSTISRLMRGDNIATTL